MTTTPEPLLITRMTRIALQILSTAEPRSKVTSPAAELVLETISSASPKLRRELLDEHLEALDWILKDAFKSQAPTATFSMETVPQDLAGGGNTAPDAPEGVIDLERIRELCRAISARNGRLQEAVDMMPEALAHAWNHGWLCGAADSTPPDPDTEEFANQCNPYGNVRGDLTP